ncbi:hypothetical protein ACFE04_020188 [Oxalis oulophora]
MGCSCFFAGSIKKWSSVATPHKQQTPEPGLENVNRFTYDQLRIATHHFHPTNKIGRGGFGTVYKGNLSNGRQIAVKTLSADSRQGVREFLAEINTMSTVKHQNLVELIGCCVEGSNRILVYEFLENNNLDRAVLGSSRSKISLNWEKRRSICLGIARGLTYLHEELVPHIVHRDIKASNILLDRDFNPKIGDFGLAKLFPDNITHISTRIAGTTYVYFIVLGPRIKVAWQLHLEGRLLELVDPNLGECPEDEVIRFIKVAFFCTQAAAGRRPLMSQVVNMLSRNIRLNEDQLTAPGFFLESGGYSGMPSTDKKSSAESIAGKPQVAVQLFAWLCYKGADLNAFAYHVLFNALVEQSCYNAAVC